MLWEPGTVQQRLSHIVQTEKNTVKRNRRHIKKTVNKFNSEDNKNKPQEDSEKSRGITQVTTTQKQPLRTSTTAIKPLESLDFNTRTIKPRSG